MEIKSLWAVRSAAGLVWFVFDLGLSSAFLDFDTSVVFGNSDCDEFDSWSFCDPSGASNFLYCAMMLLQVLHLYSPFSYSVTPSPRSSLGFSKLMFGDPS